jgi:SAM-dependent methyltransferase
LAENIRKKVLDFGCGVGWLAFLIEKNFKAEVYGLDPDKVAVDLGNAFISDKKEKIVYYSSFYNQNIKERKFPFKNSAFDLIISKATLFEAPSKGLGGYVKENLDDLKFTISELDRVLKINGALLIETNTQWKTLYNIFEGTDLHPYAVFVSKKDKKEWKLLKKK